MNSIYIIKYLSHVQYESSREEIVSYTDSYNSALEFCKRFLELDDDEWKFLSENKYKPFISRENNYSCLMLEIEEIVQLSPKIG